MTDLTTSRRIPLHVSNIERQEPSNRSQLAGRVAAFVASVGLDASARLLGFPKGTVLRLRDDRPTNEATRIVVRMRLDALTTNDAPAIADAQETQCNSK